MNDDDERATADELLAVVYDEAADVARRVEAARLWRLLSIDEDAEHGMRVYVFLVVAVDRLPGGEREGDPLPFELGPPEGWAPRSAA